MTRPFYITTTLPYVNADLHLGHALEFVRADVVARYHKKIGDEVFFNTGTDEHGMKIFEKAKEAGKTPQEFVDENFLRFKESIKIFGVLDDVHFIRTTDKTHEAVAQEFWRRVSDNGFIYKKNYTAKYCVGCESEKTDSDLVNGECPDHKGIPLRDITEENYFFRFSAFQKKLLDFYAENSSFVIPSFRFNEARAFVIRGLDDFSISRLKEKMPWGTPVPGDEKHVMYVWFDALTNYISTLGWGTADETNFEKFWKNGTPTQYCGKDNTRFQAIIWQAMLMAAGVPNSHQIVVNGFIMGEGGVKMSKTLGNVVDPKNITSEYGTDALRFFLLKEVSSFEDSAFSAARFKEVYNALLANGLGNLVSRTLTMASNFETGLHKSDSLVIPQEVHGFSMVADINALTVESYITGHVIPTYNESFQKYELTSAIETLWELIGLLDRLISHTEPFKLVKTDPQKAEAVLYDVLSGIHTITDLLQPFLPQTSQNIREHLGTYDSNRPDVFVVTKIATPLFPRKV